MKLSWLFGSTMEQRHLLYVYLSVWLIQGVYFAWVAANWARSRRNYSISNAAPIEPRDLS